MPTLTTLIIYGDVISDKLKDAAGKKNIKLIPFSDVRSNFIYFIIFLKIFIHFPRLSKWDLNPMLQLSLQLLMMLPPCATLLELLVRRCHFEKRIE